MESDEESKESIKSGIRILAKIISREVLKDRLKAVSLSSRTQAQIIFEDKTDQTLE